MFPFTRCWRRVLLLATLLVSLAAYGIADARPCNDGCGPPQGESTPPPPPPPPPVQPPEGQPPEGQPPADDRNIFVEDLPTGNLARDGAGLLITFGDMWPGGSMPHLTARGYQDQIWEWLRTHPPEHPQYGMGQRDEGSLAWHLEQLRLIHEQALAEERRRNQEQGGQDDGQQEGGQDEGQQQGEQGEDPCVALGNERAALQTELDALASEIMSLSGEMSEAEKELRLVQQDIAAKKADIQQLRTDLRSTEDSEEKKGIQAQIDAAELELANLEGQASALRSVIQQHQQRGQEIINRQLAIRARMAEIDALCAKAG